MIIAVCMTEPLRLLPKVASCFAYTYANDLNILTIPTCIRQNMCRHFRKVFAAGNSFIIWHHFLLHCSTLSLSLSLSPPHPSLSAATRPPTPLFREWGQCFMRTTYYTILAALYPLTAGVGRCCSAVSILWLGKIDDVTVSGRRDKDRGPQDRLFYTDHNFHLV